MLPSKLISYTTGAIFILLGMSLLASQAQATNTSTVSLALGNMQVGTTSTAHSVTLTNSGIGPLFYQSATITGVNAANFAIQNDNCMGKILAIKANCKIYVTFTPNSIGSEAATLTLTDSSLNPKDSVTQTVALSGMGVPPSGSALPNPLAFGNMQVGTTSATKTVTVTNTGLGSLTFNSAAISGTNAADFAIKANNCTGKVLDPTSLTGGTSTCSIDVTFTPSALLGRSATLTLSDGAGTITVSQMVSLRGTGVLPSASLTPTSLIFSNTQAGLSSATQTVKLTNTGLGPLSYGGAALLSAQFTQTNNCGVRGTIMQPGEFCTVTVTFNPTSADAKSATLTVGDTAGIQSVALSGTGVAPSASVSPTSLAFGNELSNTASVNKTVTITNTGIGPLSFNNAAIGVNGNQYIVVITGKPTSCATVGTLLPAATCTVDVAFKPTTAGSKDAKLTLKEMSGNVTVAQKVGLSGNGQVLALPTSRAFGTRTTGSTTTLTLTLTNNSPGALTINAPTLSGSNPNNFAFTNNCSASLGAGLNCTISVRFKPILPTGSKSANLNVNYLLTGSTTVTTQVVPLTGAN